MKKTKIIALFLAVVMLCSLFSGCGIFGGKTVLKVGNKNISEDVYAATLVLADSQLQQQFGFSFATALDAALDEEGTTGADFLRENADSMLREFESVRNFAAKNGIKLTAENKKEIAEAKKADIEAAGGKQAYLDQLHQSGFNEALVDYVTECQYLYMMVYEKLFQAGGEYAPDIAEIATNLANNYVRVKHILVLCDEGAADEAEKKAKAEAALKRARAGEDFDALIKEIGEDPGMTSTPDGYLLDKNGATPEGTSMVKEFSDASNALAVDGVSDLVRTSYGFHIIKRFPLTEEFVKENEETYAESFALQVFNAELSKVMEETEIVKTKAYETFDIHAVFDAEAPLGAGAEEHYEGDGHDHGAEDGIEEAPTVEITPAE